MGKLKDILVDFVAYIMGGWVGYCEIIAGLLLLNFVW